MIEIGSFSLVQLAMVVKNHNVRTCRFKIRPTFVAFMNVCKLHVEISYKIGCYRSLLSLFLKQNNTYL